MQPDTKRVLTAQALRAFAYGLGSVLLAGTLKSRHYSHPTVGLILGAVIAGAVVSSLAIGRWGDRFGRRRSYVGLYFTLAAIGIVFAFVRNPLILALVALTGALSTDVVESGPFTSLEQAMIASDLEGRERIKGFGLYNAVAAASGSLGALFTAGLGLIHRAFPHSPQNDRYFLIFVPVCIAGAVVAWSLSANVEAPVKAPSRKPLGSSRRTVHKLAGLFAVDAFAGGFVVTSFVGYWLQVRFNASLQTVGIVFFTLGLLQTISFLLAAKLANRFGLLNTMVFSHLPSNALLAAIAFAPNLGVAIGLLFARGMLSQMDVPTRQAYVMALVEPEDRTPAAVYTNTVRYAARPIGPAIAGAVLGSSAGSPFLIAGIIKSVYDIVLWQWFRNVKLPQRARD